MADDEAGEQRAFLRAPIGVAGSGGVRYAAAMYFYTRAAMSIEMLEVYRICAKFDREDPIEVARHKGVAIPPVVDWA